MLLSVLVGTGVPSSFVVSIKLKICSVKYERERGLQAEEQEVHVPTLVNGSAVRDEEKEVPTLANAEVPTLADTKNSFECRKKVKIFSFEKMKLSIFEFDTKICQNL
jgi:hypothetical protein